MHKRLWWILALLTVFLLSTTALGAAAKRQRRKRPGSSTPSGEVSKPAKPKPSSGSSDAGAAAGGAKSLDAQIAKTQANIRRYRRATADAVNAANLSGTVIFIPGGVPAGTAVDYSSKHAGKTVRGKVKATGSGEKAAATITASRAK